MGRKRGFSAVEDAPVSTSTKRKANPVPSNTIAFIDLSSSPEHRNAHKPLPSTIPRRQSVRQSTPSSSKSRVTHRPDILDISDSDGGLDEVAAFRHRLDGLVFQQDQTRGKGKARERGDDDVLITGRPQNQKAAGTWAATPDQRRTLPPQFSIEDWDYDPATLDAEQLEAIAVVVGAEERPATTGVNIGSAGPAENASTHNTPSLAESSSAQGQPRQIPGRPEETAHPEEVGLERMSEVIVDAVLSIIPDTDRDRLTAMVYAYLAAYGSGNVVEALVQEILENPLVEGDDRQNPAQAQNPGEGMGGAQRTDHGATKTGRLAGQIETSIHADGLPEELDQEEQGDGSGECGCCCDAYPLSEMVQCSNAAQVHHFCFQCVRLHAEHQIGNRDPVLACIHTSGCSSIFVITELRRLLPEKLLALYERLLQQKELKAANIPGLEGCPFCDWACIMETPKEVSPIMVCGNQEDCGAVSCRLCRRKQHPSKSCKEMETAGNERVMMEEAMTEAVKRFCPRCRKPFIKTDGCNKMTCPDKDCRALSCYVCKIEIAGYEHFRQDPGDPSKPICPLWDDVNLRHELEVGEVVDQYNYALPDFEMA